MSRIGDAMEERSVSGNDRQIVASLMQACFAPPAWRRGLQVKLPVPTGGEQPPQADQPT
jgi:hypothetical protein